MRRLTSLLLASATLLTLALSATAQTTQAEGTPADEATQLSLDRLVISAGAEKVAIDTPQAVTVLDQDDIDQLQATTIGDMLEGIPGVSVQGGASALGQGSTSAALAPDSPIPTAAS